MSEPLNEGGKPWWKSKGVWGGVITVLAAGAGAMGIDVGPDAQDQAVKHITTLVGAGGGLFALIGRLMAKDKIKSGA